MAVMGLGRCRRWTESRTPSLSALALWARQFALLVRAGLTTAEALATLGEQPDDPQLATVSRGLYSGLLRGELLAGAMAQLPGVFPAYIHGLIRVAEAAGTLPEALERMAMVFEREAEVRGRLWHASFYPAVVGTITTMLALLLTGFVVPQFASFYSDFSGGEAQLPLLTRRVMQFADALMHYWPWLLLSPLAVWALLLWRQSCAGRAVLDPLQLRLPLFGLITRKTETARCARGLAALMCSGVPINEALELAAGCTANYAVRRALRGMSRRVLMGKNLVEALRFEPVFAPLLPSMIAAATNASEAAANLEHLADAYEADVQRSLGVLMRQVEPALLIAIGLYTGLVAVSLYLPIFNLVGVTQ